MATTKTPATTISTQSEETVTAKLYVEYSKQGDKTFIMIDKIKENGDVASTEVVGFYFGSPNHDDTMKYIGNLKAIF